MAERVIALTIQVKGTKEETAALQKLQGSVDSLKKEIAKVNFEERKGIITAKEASDARAKLNVQYKANSNALQDLQGHILKNNDALRKNSGFVNGIKAGIQGAIPSFRELAGAFGLAFSVGALVNFGKESILLSAKMESLRNTFNFAFGSVEDGGKALDFVRDLSEELGLELLSTADAFKKFSASSVLAGVSSEETKKQFRQVSLGVTALGLSAEDANGVFLALSQIMSKGTVQAEELRGQIGERIPGAFELAAKAMGVTTAELNKMLQKGEVISKDFLPKFAQQMEDTFGSAVPAAVDSTQAKLNRLSNFFTEFSAKAGVFLVDIAEGLAGGFSGAFDFSKFSLLTSQAVGFTDAQAKALEEMGFKAKGSTEEIAKAGNELLQYQKALNETTKSINQGAQSIDVLKRELLKQEVTTSAGIIKFNLLKKAIDEISVATKSVSDVQEKSIVTIDLLKKKLSGLEKELSSTEIGTKAFRDLQNEIKKTQAEIDAALGKTKQFGDQFVKPLEQKTEQLNKALGEIPETLGEIKQVASTGILSGIENDFSQATIALNDLQIALNKFLESDKGKATEFIIAQAQSTLSSISEIQGNVVDNRIKDIERETEKQIESIDLQIEAQKRLGNNTDALEARKKQLQDASAKRVEEQQRKAFEFNKRVSILNATISGAEAVLKALATIPPPFNAAAAIAAGIASAAQIAVITSQKFAEGGIVPNGGGIIKGNSHANGGVKFAAGGMLNEAQGGEPILVKEAGADPATRSVLSAINVAHGGRAFAEGGIVPAHRFQTGGRVPSFSTRNALQSAVGINAKDIAETFSDLIDNKIANIKVTNVVTDTSAEQSKINNIQSEVNFR